MFEDQQIAQIKNNLQEAKQILIILGPNASADQASCALALFNSLKNLNKDLNLISPEPVELKNILDLENFKYKLGNKDLSISFDYIETAVDKVSYHIDEEKKKFYLIVKPQAGQKPLDTSQVSFDYTGAEADLIFLIGIHDLSGLDHLYQKYESVYNNAVLVTINNFQPDIGSIKIDLSGKSCWSENMLNFLEKLDLSLDANSATNLLFNIQQATNNLTSYTASADTFEAVAKLMRSGGKRQKIVSPDLRSLQKKSPPPKKPTEIKLKKSQKSKSPDPMKNKNYVPREGKLL